MAENSLNVSEKLDTILQYLENNSQVKRIDTEEVESIFNSLVEDGNENISTEDFVNMFAEYYVDEDKAADVSEIEDDLGVIFSDIASIDGNSEEFSSDEFDIFLSAVENSNEYNDSGYADDERIKTDEEGNHYVTAEKWKSDSSVNGCLYNIIKNSYNFEELGISFSEAYSVLLSAIAEKNGISDVNLINENQKIILVDPYEALGIEKPEAEDIIVEVPTVTESPSEDEGSDISEPTDDTTPSTGTSPTTGTEPIVTEPPSEITPTSVNEPPVESEPEPDEDVDDNSEALNAALSDIYAELEKRKSETETEAESKTGFGAAWNAIKGAFGGGTKGELSEIEELEELYESVMANPTEDAVKELYETVFGTELDLETVSAGSEISESLMNGTYSINGVEISTEDVVSALEDQVAALDESFSDTTSSQGIISKGISWLNNNLLGIGTTKDMTQAQIDELSNQVDKLKNAESAEEFASIYKSITGEDLSEESISELFEGETSKLEDTTAAESMIDYENTTDNIKNTVIAVGVGIATAATGGIAGAVALGVGATVAINAIDAGTQDNGQSVGENLLEYAQTDMVKDACVGAINGLTGKLGNMAGEKLVSTFAAKKIGGTAATELVETTMEQAAAKGLSTAAQQSAANAALKGTLSTGTRIVTEFADGALDAGLSSAGEYVVAAAAGENGNFTNADGKLIDDDGNLAFLNNLSENFDATEMAEQVVVSTLLGGVMSAGMQEGMYFISKGVDSVKSGGGDDVKVDIDTDDVKIDTDTDVRIFSDVDSADLKTGDIVQSANSEHIGIKLTDGSIQELGISAETFNKLFPDGYDLKIEQQNIGDCYLVSSIYSLMENPDTRSIVLQCFTENADGSITVKFPKGNVEFTFDAGKNISDYVETTKIMSGSEGAAMLEYTYGLELVDRAARDSQDQLSRQLSELDFWNTGLDSLNSQIDVCNTNLDLYNKRISLMQALLDTEGEGAEINTTVLRQYADDIFKYMGNENPSEEAYRSLMQMSEDGSIDYSSVKNLLMIFEQDKTNILLNIDNLSLKIDDASLKIDNISQGIDTLQQTIDNLTNNVSDAEKNLRGNGGLMYNVYSMFGLDSGSYSSGSDEAKELLLNTDNWSKYVLNAATNGKTDTKFLNESLDIVGNHAYTITPKQTSNGEIEIEITNPWHTNQHTTLTFDQFLNYFRSLHYAKIE